MARNGTTPTMQAIETAHGGKPIKALIRELYRRYGRDEDVARELGIHKSTLDRWKLKLRLKTRRVTIAS